MPTLVNVACLQAGHCCTLHLAHCVNRILWCIAAALRCCCTLSGSFDLYMLFGSAREGSVGAALPCECAVLGASSGCVATSAVNLLQAQAHTMDTYLPQRLQDEAAATSLAREAAAAAAAAKPAKQPRVSSPTITLSNASQATGSQAPKAAVPVALYATQASQPYVTPMPVTVKSSSQANFPRDVQQEPPKAYKHPIESTADIGQGESVVQLEQGLDVLDLNDDEEDLEAPSSFCCPITTVRFPPLLLCLSMQCCVCCFSQLQCLQYTSKIAASKSPDGPILFPKSVHVVYAAACLWVSACLSCSTSVCSICSMCSS